jgi:hypothetical protein
MEKRAPLVVELPEAVGVKVHDRRGHNSPRRTGLIMDVATLSAVCDVAPVIGVKEASRNFFHTTG